MVKNLPAVQETQSQEDPLEKGVATHSSILAWRVLGQRSLAGYSPWGRKRARYDLATNTFTFTYLEHFPGLMYQN